MDTTEIKKVIDWLKSRVILEDSEGTAVILFEEPETADFVAAGFDQEMVDRTLKAAWWDEMVTDIRETPDFAEPDEAPEMILKYARDVVYEYVGKRIL